MKKIDSIFKQDDLRSAEYVGEVVDSNDPKKSGRCRVRVYGKYDDLKDDELPWAHPEQGMVFASKQNGGNGSFSYPKKGTKVKVRFFNGDLYHPVYSAIMKPNAKMLEEIKNSYENSHVINYDEDEDFKMYYTPEHGLEIYLKGSHITINADKSVTIEHAESKSIIELVGTNINVVCNNKVEITANNQAIINAKEAHVNGKRTKIGANPNYSEVMAEPLWAYIKSLAAVVDAKLPISPGVNSAAAAAAEQASTSKTVKTSL